MTSPGAAEPDNSDALAGVNILNVGPGMLIPVRMAGSPDSSSV